MNELQEHDLKRAIHSMYHGFVPRRFGDRDFYEFLTRTDALASMLLYKHRTGSYDIDESRYRFQSKIPAAYTNGHTIFMPTMYLTEEFYSSLGVSYDAMIYAAIACVNGSQLHEALHIAETSFAELESSKFRYPELSRYWQQIAVIVNIVEDLFIERPDSILQVLSSGKRKIYIDQTFVSQLLLFKNNILFNEALLEEALREFTEKPSVATALQIFVFLKSSDLRDIVLASLAEDARMLAVFNEFNNVATAPVIDDKWDTTFGRIDLSVKIFRMLINESPEGESGLEPSDSPDVDSIEQMLANLLAQLMGGEDPGNGDGESEGDGEADGEDDGNAKAVKALCKALGIDDDELEIITAFANNMTDNNDEHERHKYSIIENDDRPIPEYRVTWGDVTRMTETTDRGFALDKRWLSFADSLRYATQERHTPAIPTDLAGSLIEKNLSRLLTDGKVLGYSRPRKQRGVPELIVLVDMSGSMHTRAANNKSYFTNAINASLGLFLSCVNGRVPIAVYGHTSEGAGNPYILPIAASNMPLGKDGRLVNHGNYKSRFLRAASKHLQVNFDGIAINEVAKLFSSRPTSKVLIVLSDGEPSGDSGYDGRRAINHTIAAITTARKAGVKVFSLSLDKSVVLSNDNIYGKMWNVDVSQGNLDATLRKLIDGLVGR